MESLPAPPHLSAHAHSHFAGVGSRAGAPFLGDLDHAISMLRDKRFHGVITEPNGQPVWFMNGENPHSGPEHGIPGGLHA